MKQVKIKPGSTNIMTQLVQFYKYNKSESKPDKKKILNAIKQE